jgi:predicted Zn-dependent protease
VPWLKGYVFEMERNQPKALASYQKAMDLGDRRLGVYKRVLELMRYQGMYAEANDLLREFPEAVKGSDDFYKSFVEATIYGTGAKESPEEALAVAEKATAKSEKYEDFLWLGQVAIAAKIPQKAEKAFFEARLKAELAMIKARQELVEAERTTTNKVELKQRTEKVRISKNVVSATWVILLLHLADTAPEKARVEMEQLNQSVLGAHQINIILAPVYEALGDAAKGDLEKAKKHYEDALAAKPNDPLLLRNVAGFYGRHGPYEKAEILLSRLLLPEIEAPTPTLQWARRSLALVLAKDGDYARFKKALELIEQNRDKGQLALADEQTRALVLAEHPAHRAEAIRELQNLDTGKSGLPAGLRFRLAQLHFAKKDYARADGQIQTLLKIAPTNPGYLSFAIQTLLRQNDTLRAALELDKLVKAHPREAATIELQARVLHATGKKDQARELLLQLAEQAKPDGNVTLRQVSKILEDLGFFAEAESTLKQHVAAAKEPESPLILARF